MQHRKEKEFFLLLLLISLFSSLFILLFISKIKRDLFSSLCSSYVVCLPCRFFPRDLGLHTQKIEESLERLVCCSFGSRSLTTGQLSSSLCEEERLAKQKTKRDEKPENLLQVSRSEGSQVSWGNHPLLCVLGDLLRKKEGK
jgi:hypothetical protein